MIRFILSKGKIVLFKKILLETLKINTEPWYKRLSLEIWEFQANPRFLLGCYLNTPGQS